MNKDCSYLFDFLKWMSTVIDYLSKSLEIIYEKVDHFFGALPPSLIDLYEEPCGDWAGKR